jgi:hypothetical protein
LFVLPSLFFVAGCGARSDLDLPIDRSSAPSALADGSTGVDVAVSPGSGTPSCSWPASLDGSGAGNADTCAAGPQLLICDAT